MWDGKGRQNEPREEKSTHTHTEIEKKLYVRIPPTDKLNLFLMQNHKSIA